MLPLMMKIKSDSFLVIGCGKIAVRKIETLLACGIKPVVLCLEIKPSLLDKIRWINALYDEKHLNEFEYVIAATNDFDLNHDITVACKKRNIKCSNVSQVETSDFFIPAVVKNNSLTITVTTHGKAPGIAKKVKRQISDLLTDSLDETIYYIEALRAAYKDNQMNEHIVTLYDMGIEKLREEGLRYEIENWNKRQ